MGEFSGQGGVVGFRFRSRLPAWSKNALDAHQRSGTADDAVEHAVSIEQAVPAGQDMGDPPPVGMVILQPSQLIAEDDHAD